MPQRELLAELHALAKRELPSRFRWHCEPRCWSVTGDGLQIKPDSPTDFWQRTHYGHRADNGHFLNCDVNGDIVLTARVAFRPVHQYDQAGVMVRVSEECWLKASVEFEPSGPSRLGAVVTSFGYSDWSTQNHAGTSNPIWLRLRREVDDYFVESSDDGEEWDMLRLAHLHDGAGAQVACGIYACSPVAPGFACEFSELSLVAGRSLQRSAPSA